MYAREPAEKERADMPVTTTTITVSNNSNQDDSSAVFAGAYLQGQVTINVNIELLVSQLNLHQAFLYGMAEKKHKLNQENKTHI